jgi:cytoskeletal protein CcmA (bactofilin family)
MASEGAAQTRPPPTPFRTKRPTVRFLRNALRMEITRGSRTYDADAQLSTLHQGSVHVNAGTLRVTGTLQGSLHVAPGARALVLGVAQGSIHVEPGGEVIVEGGGHISGSAFIDGRLTVRGAQSGPISGAGEVSFEPGSRRARPVQIGPNAYDWRFD